MTEKLTGEVRHRVGWRQRLVLQVETTSGWKDAKPEDIRALVKELEEGGTNGRLRTDDRLLFLL